MKRERTPVPEPVAQLQRQLEQFRSTQPGRTKLPESLWQAAVELARQYGVYPVAHPLRLDYTRLKKRIDGSPTFRRKATKPAFMELVAPPRNAERIGYPEVIQVEERSELNFPFIDNPPSPPRV